MSLFKNRLEYVTCKTWQTGRSDFQYPEQSDPEFRVDELTNRPNLGLVFSGGGTRAASAALGQLRGLSALGILDKARYLSCVSGGSFTSTAFTYLPDSSSEKIFLGPVIAPADMTSVFLEKTEKGSFAHAIANAILIDDFLKNAATLAGDETYSRTVGNIFLGRFDLDARGRFFSYDDKTVATILEHNPKMTPHDFYRVRPGRPYLIINATIITGNDQPELPSRLPLETTPHYVGVPVLHKGIGAGSRDIGGGFVEPFGFDTQAPEAGPDDLGRVTVRLGASRYRYTLSDAIGTSGAAPAKSLVEDGLTFVGFPEFKYWPPTGLDKSGAVKGSAHEYEFGDGGDLDYMGLMPLLARRVKNIIVFINTRRPLTGGGDGQISRALPPLFTPTSEFPHNVVFPQDDYQQLVAALLSARQAGVTVMHKARYDVLANPFWGIEGGWQVDLLWVYNERVPEWESELPAGISSLIGAGSLHNFPHYKTFRQNPPAVIDLRPEQVHMLANLSCWNVISNETIFKSML